MADRFRLKVIEEWMTLAAAGMRKAAVEIQESTRKFEETRYWRGYRDGWEDASCDECKNAR